MTSPDSSAIFLSSESCGPASSLRGVAALRQVALALFEHAEEAVERRADGRRRRTRSGRRRARPHRRARGRSSCARRCGTRRDRLVHRHEQAVGVAVVADLAHGLYVAGALALLPVLLARAAPEPRVAGLHRLGERLGVHVGDHQHLAGARLLDHGGDEACASYVRSSMPSASRSVSTRYLRVGSSDVL